MFVMKADRLRLLGGNYAHRRATQFVGNCSKSN